MKIALGDIQKTYNKFFEKLQNGCYKGWLADIWSRNQEILIAAIAGLIIGVIIMFTVLR